MAFLDPILNPVLLPLVQWNPFFAIVIISLLISLMIVFIYKWVTNQDEMKKLKEEQKEYQKKLKSLKNDPQEMMKVQKEAMKKNMAYMKHSFKPTLITFIPIILIFGWMNGHLAFESLNPGDTFSVTALFNEEVTGEAEMILDEGLIFSINENIGTVSEAKQVINGDKTWYLKGEAGEHFITVKVGEVEQTKKVLITNELEYEEQISVFDRSAVKQIKVNYEKLKPVNEWLSSGDKEANFSLFGWEPGWLGWYIIFSLVFSMGLRKLLKIY
ncbi:MAG: TMCO1/EMC3 family protein [Nanoarchaeota archaeon]|nr:TMCO1/EMC3 family protein [Nanoarchaeota archaeon]